MTVTNWIDSLPNEVFDKIFQKLTLTEAFKNRGVCKRWKDFIEARHSQQLLTIKIMSELSKHFLNAELVSKEPLHKLPLITVLTLKPEGKSFRFVKSPIQSIDNRTLPIYKRFASPEDAPPKKAFFSTKLFYSLPVHEFILSINSNNFTDEEIKVVRSCIEKANACLRKRATEGSSWSLIQTVKSTFPCLR